MGEGRIRPNSANTAFVYDYFLKDHLGNTRMVVTDDYSVASPILEASSYYPFGLQQKGIGLTATLPNQQNKYLYNGKELQEDLGLDQYDYGARFYDAQIGRMATIDPHTESYNSYTPYNYVLNNPINTIDPDGRDTKSTHTDSLGHVLAVFDDGDNGVYVHNGSTSAAQVEKDHSANNTSAGGTKVGETEFWDEFAQHDAEGNIVGNNNGNFANSDATIHFGVSMNALLTKLNSIMANAFKNMGGLEGKALLRKMSGAGGPLDIKRKLGAADGYLYNGKYVTGESLGNNLFGMNLESLRESTSLDNLRYPFYNKANVWNAAAEAFGHYNNTSNHLSIPENPPYYGEIPYSGRQVMLGYWGGLNNPVYETYGNTTLYGNVKVK